MSDYAFYFACAAIITGGLGLTLGIIISAWEYSNEIEYGNGKETGLKDKHRE